MISIVMDNNERGTDRHTALVEYLTRHTEYKFNFGDVEVDLLFVLDPAEDGVVLLHDKVRAVELKTPADFVQSLQNGHLSTQRRNCPYPLQIAVLGSLGDVLRALPEATTNGWKNPGEMVKAEGMVRRGIAALKASGIDVSFGIDEEDFYNSIPIDYEAAKMDALKANIAQVCREATAYLEGDIHLPMPKAENWQEYCLMGLPGVGPERARAMLESGCYVGLAGRSSEGPTYAIDEDCLTQINGIGPKTAAKILEATKNGQ